MIFIKSNKNRYVIVTIYYIFLIFIVVGTHGLEGEIFGANMILKSTIERNYTIKNDPQYQQKLFQKNKLLGNNNNIKYIVLNDMKVDTVPDNSETTKSPIFNTTRSFIKLRTSHGSVEHDVGLDLIPKKMKWLDIQNEKEILDFTMTPKINPGKQDYEKINFWNLLNVAGNMGKFKGQNIKVKEQSGAGTQELPTVSEYETPPPPVSFRDYIHTSVKIKKPILKTHFEMKEDEKLNPTKNNVGYNYEVSEVVKPPPVSKNTKVYGQWTSSQFANSVLNYLKNNNFENNKVRKVPPTIPLIKLSDNFPYASDYKVTKIHLPHKYERRSFKDYDINKREKRENPQINVLILKDDLRTEILESHAKTLARNVEIINRGENVKNNNDQRFYRSIDKEISKKPFSLDFIKPTPFTSASTVDSQKILADSYTYKDNHLMTILPFLKSSEYYFNEYFDKKSIDSNEMYTKSLSNANKWHNVNSYNIDYTPRRFNMESSEIQSSNDKDLDQANNKHPLLQVKYKPDNHKIVKTMDETEINDGRVLALEISNLSDTNPNSASIFKYNHGFLPASKYQKSTYKPVSNLVFETKNNNLSNNNKFDQRIKIGNALNERYIIGENEEEKKNSFIGGSEKIPDINRYRSDIDHGSETVPPSLGPKVCKNVEFYDRLLYIQPDGSVDVTHILSPVKEKNLGIEFIIQNYKKCSLEESIFEKNDLLFIDWNKTPVRLFGGSYPKKTTDLCGFF